MRSMQIHIPIGCIGEVADFVETTNLKGIFCGRWGDDDEITVDFDYDDDERKEIMQILEMIDDYRENEENEEEENEESDEE